MHLSLVLQYHYNILAALALQQDTPSPDDTTLPDIGAIVSRAGSILKSINETLSSDPRYSQIKWRKSATANVIGGTSASISSRNNRDADTNGDDEPERKKVKVSKEKPSVGIEKLEKLLVKGFKDGDSALKKVRVFRFFLLLFQPLPPFSNTEYVISPVPRSPMIH